MYDACNLRTEMHYAVDRDLDFSSLEMVVRCVEIAKRETISDSDFNLRVGSR